MSAILREICAKEARVIELRMRLTTPDAYHDPRDIAEIAAIERDLRKLWPRRQYELAGASEAARRYADQLMRYGQQGQRTDLIEREVSA